MTERPKFFDDLAGVAGGAFSALAGVREEAETMIRARVDEAIRRLDLVKRDDLDAVQEMAANARAGQEAAEAKLSAIEARLSALEGTSAKPSPAPEPTMSKPDPSEAGASEVAPGTMVPGSGAPGSVMPPPSPDGVA